MQLTHAVFLQTANLASILTAEKQFTGISGIDDLVDMRLKVCVDESVVSFPAPPPPYK